MENINISEIGNEVRNITRFYILIRIMAHRAVMDFEDIESTLNTSYEKENNINNNEFSVPNLIDKIMRPSKKRILKLTLKSKI